MNRPTDKQIEEVLAGIASKELANEVAHWFATDEGMAWLSESMDKDLEKINPGNAELYVNHTISSEQMLVSLLKQIRRKRMRRILYRVAAVLIPFVLILGLFNQLNNQVDLFGSTEMEEVFVPRGERIQLMFQDGTRAYINSGSRLKYPRRFGFNKREVYLEGEAYFIVSSNKKRPFIVNLEGPSVQVLGTSFNIESYPEDKDIVVCLDNGSVNFATLPNKKYPMLPGERLVYNKATGRCEKYTNSNNNQISLWKENRIAFKDASLQEVIQKLGRWYDVTFKVQDQKAWNIALFTLVSDNIILTEMLNDLEKISPLKFSYNKEMKEVLVDLK